MGEGQLDTDAGTSITNNVSVAYNVGGTAQTAETDSDTFVVDREVNLVIAESGNGNTTVARVITGSGVWKNLKYGACLAEIVFVWKSKVARGARHTWQKIL